MKTVLYSVCIGSLALALAAQAGQGKQKGAGRAMPQRAANVHAAQSARSGAMMGARHNSAAQFRQRSDAMSRANSGFNRKAVAATRSPQRIGREGAAARSAAIRQPNVAKNQAMRERNFARNQEFRAGRNAGLNREKNLAANRTRNVEMNRDRNEFRGRNNMAINPNGNFATNGERNFAYYRGRNVGINNNFHSEAFRGQKYAAFRNYHKQWHDRGWWRSHYNRIVFVNGGWYYWNAGYWFPAWGYDPSVSYLYDGPIYAVNGMAPDQVIVDVQEQLQRDGYYDGAVDGVLGPMTREAIAAFQADNGLAVTSVIDQPTLATLGIS